MIGGNKIQPFLLQAQKTYKVRCHRKLNLDL